MYAWGLKSKRKRERETERAREREKGEGWYVLSSVQWQTGMGYGIYGCLAVLLSSVLW